MYVRLLLLGLYSLNYFVTADYGPLYIHPFEAASGLIGAALLLLIPAWWLMDGDISRWRWLAKHVQSQTKWREGDDVRTNSAREHGKDGWTR